MRSFAQVVIVLLDGDSLLLLFPCPALGGDQWPSLRAALLVFFSFKLTPFFNKKEEERTMALYIY
jgi:hypothetical protein